MAADPGVVTFKILDGPEFHLEKHCLGAEVGQGSGGKVRVGRRRGYCMGGEGKKGEGRSGLRRSR